MKTKIIKGNGKNNNNNNTKNPTLLLFQVELGLINCCNVACAIPSSGPCENDQVRYVRLVGSVG